MTFEELRQKHKEFIFEKFDIQQEGKDLKITFFFTLAPDIVFTPNVILPDVSEKMLKQVQHDNLNLVFNLGMVELLSYWKAACPQTIVIKAGYLDQQQIKFWKNLLIKGLGEFFYQNKIDFTREDIVKFVIDSSVIPAHARLASERAGIQLNKESRDDVSSDLVLVGGGKDSVVTVRVLSKTKRDKNCLLLNPTDAARKIVETSGFNNPIVATRIIDPKLLELNEQGYLNGHTPFSAYLAFLSVLIGVVYDYQNLIVSNESSSNEGNITWLEHEINHQYSKSFEFEQLFREYNQNYLSSTNYFSFLRPLNEIQISKLFSGMSAYHHIFRSCNVGSKDGIWCGECPKCVSTFLLLYPFLGEETNKIFGRNSFENSKIIPVIEGLMRLNDQVKPFECVASVDEIKYAIFLSIKKFQEENKLLPKVLEAVQDQAEDKSELLTSWNLENNLNEEYKELLKSHMLRNVIPSNEGIQLTESAKVSSNYLLDPRLPVGRHGMHGDDKKTENA